MSKNGLQNTDPFQYNNISSARLMQGDDTYEPVDP